MTIPDNPTRAEIEEAVATLLQPFEDFPYASAADRAATLALFLTLLLRATIVGPVPIFLVSAPAPGTGKTLLVTALGIAVLGEAPAMAPEIRDGEEMIKTLGAMLASLPEIVVLDNIAGHIGSGIFSGMVTAPYFTTRILGLSKMAELPVRAVFVMTANNPTLSNELLRRMVLIRLVATTDQPWLRRGFKIENLRAYVEERRPALIRAGLILARGWFAAGSPRPTSTPLGSFEEWHRVVGGVLEFAGVPDFLANLEGFQSAADAETTQWNTFTSEWWQAHGDRHVRSAELVAIALRSEVIDEGKNDRATQTSLGRALSKMADRTFGGYQIVDGGVVAGSRMWQVLDIKSKGHRDFRDLNSTPTQKPDIPAYQQEIGPRSPRSPSEEENADNSPPF